MPTSRIDKTEKSLVIQHNRTNGDNLTFHFRKLISSLDIDEKKFWVTGEIKAFMDMDIDEVMALKNFIEEYEGFLETE